MWNPIKLAKTADPTNIATFCPLARGGFSISLVNNSITLSLYF